MPVIVNFIYSLTFISFFNFKAPLPPLGKGSSPLGLSMNALPPLKRNSSLDKVKSMDKIGSSLSPLSSPKPKPASLTKRENLGRPNLGKTLSQGLSTDTEENRSLSLAKSPIRDNPSNYYEMI